AYMPRWSGAAADSAFSPAMGWRRSLCIDLHRRQFVAGRVEKMETTTTWEAKDRFGDRRSRSRDRGKRGFQILDLDHGKRGFGRLLLVGLKSNIHIPGECAGIRRPETGHRHAEHRLEKSPARRKVASGQLDEVGSGHDRAS